MDFYEISGSQSSTHVELTATKWWVTIVGRIPVWTEFLRFRKSGKTPYNRKVTFLLDLHPFWAREYL